MRPWPALDRRRLRARFSGWGGTLARPRGWMTVAGVAVALVLALAGVAVAGGFARSGGGTGAAGLGRPGSARPAARRPAQDPVRPGRSGSQPATASKSAARARTGPPRAGAAAAARTGELRTSCRSAAHIGDSTSADLISPSYLPDPAQRLAARYGDVGVTHLRVDASGGRSIVEVLPGQVNGYNVARAWWNEGYRGCWVFALGTNDAANVSVGSAVGLTARIDRMMSVAHGEPVLWVNTRTLLSGGPWAESNERLWDDTLVRALARYPNMRIFNWAAVAQQSWFLPDGIHYNSAGCAARAAAIADALARAFPRYGHSAGRIVS